MCVNAGVAQQKIDKTLITVSDDNDGQRTVRCASDRIYYTTEVVVIANHNKAVCTSDPVSMYKLGALKSSSKNYLSNCNYSPYQ